MLSGFTTTTNIPDFLKYWVPINQRTDGTNDQPYIEGHSNKSSKECLFSMDMSPKQATQLLTD